MTKSIYPQFEATEQNIMSIIDMLIYHEQATNKTSEQIIKKYTEQSCGDLAALIKKLVPDAKIVLGIAYKLQDIENLPYHFMIKIQDTNNPSKDLYFDINGKHERKGLEEYVATILSRDSQSEVGFFERTSQKRDIESNNKPALKCLTTIAQYPHIISKEQITK